MSKGRTKAIVLLFFTLFTFLILRIFYFQVFNGNTLSKAAITQRMRDPVDIGSFRGEIFDKTLIPFTNRNAVYIIVLKPLYLRGKEDELKRVCEALDLDMRKVKRDMDTSVEPIFIETDREIKEMILGWNLEGASVINSLRRYDEDSIARHVTGYLNSVDGVGGAGIEKFYEEVLKYESGETVNVVTDARNNPVQGLGYRILTAPPPAGKLNVRLTLDYHIQKIAEEVMDKHGVSGAVVVEDILNGDVSAMVSKPDFNHAEVGSYLESSRMELFNKAVASYNLGSIFKIIDTCLFLEKGGNPDMTYFCGGSTKIGERDFKCYEYERGGHGWIDLAGAFKLSCNTYFIETGLKLGYSELISMAKSFGLGEITGIKYQGVDESPGNLPLIDKYHSDGDIANISIGQGEIMATPLQVTNIIAALAGDGIMNKVNIVDSIVDSDGNKIRDLRVRESARVISKETAVRIRKLMEEVTESGTGQKAYLEKYGGTAGKTGSAETGSDSPAHAWFAGYFPRKVPKYAMTVFVEGGRSGGDIAAPIFAEIAENIMKKGY